MKRPHKLLAGFLTLAFVTFTGILFNVDPYETTSSIRAIFFISLGVLVAGLIGGVAFFLKRKKSNYSS